MFAIAVIATLSGMLAGWGCGTWVRRRYPNFYKSLVPTSAERHIGTGIGTFVGFFVGLYVAIAASKAFRLPLAIALIPVLTFFGAGVGDKLQSYTRRIIYTATEQ